MGVGWKAWTVTGRAPPVRRGRGRRRRGRRPWRRPTRATPTGDGSRTSARGATSRPGRGAPPGCPAGRARGRPGGRRGRRRAARPDPRAHGARYSRRSTGRCRGARAAGEAPPRGLRRRPARATRRRARPPTRAPFGGAPPNGARVRGRARRRVARAGRRRRPRGGASPAARAPRHRPVDRRLYRAPCARGSGRAARRRPRRPPGRPRARPAGQPGGAPRPGRDVAPLALVRDPSPVGVARVGRRQGRHPRRRRPRPGRTGGARLVTVHAFHPTPIARLLLVGEPDGAGGTRLAGIYMEQHRHGPVVDPSWAEDAAAFGEVARELDEYFDGSRTTFDLPLAPAGTPFQRRVSSSQTRRWKGV